MGCPTVKEILEEEEGAVLKERVDSCAPERGGLCSVIGTVAVFCFQKGILLRSGIILTVKMKTAAATSFSSFLPVRAKSLSHVGLFVTPWTVARQAPLSKARILECVALPSSRGSS